MAAIRGVIFAQDQVAINGDDYPPGKVLANDGDHLAVKFTQYVRRVGLEREYTPARVVVFKITRVIPPPTLGGYPGQPEELILEEVVGWKVTRKK